MMTFRWPPQATLSWPRDGGSAGAAATAARGEMGVPSEIPFSLGRIRTLLPLDSGGRQRSAAGMQANRQYLDR